MDQQNKHLNSFFPTFHFEQNVIKNWFCRLWKYDTKLTLIQRCVAEPRSFDILVETCICQLEKGRN
jgi:hypothetical protein